MTTCDPRYSRDIHFVRAHASVETHRQKGLLSGAFLIAHGGLYLYNPILYAFNSVGFRTFSGLIRMDLEDASIIEKPDRQEVWVDGPWTEYCDVKYIADFAKELRIERAYPNSPRAQEDFMNFPNYPWQPPDPFLSKLYEPR